MTIKKYIFIAALFIAGLGALIAYKMYNKPHKDIASSPEVATLIANDMLLAFKDDETAANLKYLDKVVCVSGKVVSVKNEQNQITLQLETEDPMSVIICNLDPYAAPSKTVFKEGDPVKIKGICSGYLSDVVMDRCIEIK